jgi:hypothetical protein
MTLAPADVTAIVGGQHGDPFAVLGPHRVSLIGFVQRWKLRSKIRELEARRRSASVVTDGLGAGAVMCRPVAR